MRVYTIVDSLKVRNICDGLTKSFEQLLKLCSENTTPKYYCTKCTWAGVGLADNSIQAGNDIPYAY